MPTVRHAKSLPDILLEQGAVTAQQLARAQAEAAKTNQPLKRVLIRMGLVTDEIVTGLLAEQLGMAVFDLSGYVIKPEVIQLVPEALARKQTLIPVGLAGGTLTVATDDPLNFFAMDDVRLQTHLDVRAVLASESAILEAIGQYYGASGTIDEVAEAVKAAEVPVQAKAEAEEAPMIRLVNLLVLQAVKERASDIHLEPGDGVLRTRFRVDGILREVKGPSFALHSAVASRIKILADLDIAERRRPQDGRFRLKLDDRDLDVRVSTIPTQHGEKLVLRLLDHSQVLLGLEQLGLNEEARQMFERLIRSPHGIILVTGPTGSGKTTTLYAALHTINSLEKNIVTIEDPIEYQLAGINQVQVSPKAEVTFATALRSFLRQDPNVIMVGEIRDFDTAEIAIQASLTGHLVFSTLHTNDAPSSLTRLLDMGVEPFLISSSVEAVMAQRLVRVICPECKEPSRPPAPVLHDLGLAPETTFFRGKGCRHCKDVGYKGRIGIFELMLMSDAIKNLVTAKAPAHAIREAAKQEGYRRLRDDGLAKAKAGITTLEEVLRVTQASG